MKKEEYDELDFLESRKIDINEIEFLRKEWNKCHVGKIKKPYTVLLWELKIAWRILLDELGKSLGVDKACDFLEKTLRKVLKKKPAK